MTSSKLRTFYNHAIDIQAYFTEGNHAGERGF